MWEASVMAISLETFLRAKKFHANPFATTNAEQETERLASFFVHVPWFDRLAGDPRFPESLILFAPRGYGKTSHRMEVARMAQNRPEAPALVINFTEFDVLLTYQPPVSSEHYLGIIRRKTLEALVARLYADPRRRTALQADEHAAARFCAMQQLYAVPVSVIQPPAVTAQWVDYYKHSRLGFHEWLRELSALARCADFASVYVLLDGIDEWAETQENPRIAIDLLKPLISAPGILQECGFAFKFFLPQVLEELLYRFHVGRLDRIPVYHLAWSDLQLQAMLSQRLTSFSLIDDTSPLGYVNSFTDLSDGAFDADELLVQAARSSPRRLLYLARQVLEAHCQIAMSADAPICESTIHTVLEQMEATGVQSYINAISLAAATVPPSSSISPLFFDERGDIWLGDRRIRQGLPRLLHRCLSYLWRQRHRTITYEELQEELYSDDPPDRVRGDPRGSCDKIVRRLRSVLEDGQMGSHTYIDVQPGVGYVLRNTREDAEQG
jgi:hypothetical protein